LNRWDVQFRRQFLSCFQALQQRRVLGCFGVTDLLFVGECGAQQRQGLVALALLGDGQPEPPIAFRDRLVGCWFGRA
jgi:hypothetical protein